MLAAIDGLRVAREVRAGRAAFHALLGRGLSAHSDLRSQAAAGVAMLEAADARARGSVWIGGWSHVPVLGSPARWLRGTTAAVAGLGRAGNDVVAKLEPRLNAARDPAGRLALLDTMAAEFARLRAEVDAVDIPGTGWFLPPVDSANAQLHRELSHLRSELDDGAVAARGIHAFLAGPSTYVVLAANNAEMRAGGMILQAGLMRALNGRIATGAFYPTGKLILDKPVTVPSQIQTLYGWLDPGREWRNTGSSPNFPAVGPIYAEMARRDSHRPIDGAIQLDVPALRSLLEVVGPVVVAGRTYDASNVERLVMHDLYVQFGPEQYQRRHEFSHLAEATFHALTQRRWDPRKLIEALARTAAGRHLMLWSARAADEQAWQRLRVDGALDRNGLMVTIQNHTGNKLDWFLRPTVDITRKTLPDGFERVTLQISIANPTPRSEPTYIAGDGSIVPRGGYRAFVVVYLPGWATNVDVVGDPTLIVGTDGPMRVIGTRVDVLRNQTRIVRIVFVAPPAARVALLPSGRFPPMVVHMGGTSFDDAGRRDLEL